MPNGWVLGEGGGEGLHIQRGGGRVRNRGQLYLAPGKSHSYHRLTTNPGGGWLGHFPLWKNKSVTLEKVHLYWEKIFFGPLAHFRYTKTPFSRKSQSVTPPRGGVCQGLSQGMLRALVLGIKMKQGRHPSTTLLINTAWPLHRLLQPWLDIFFF